MSVSRRPVIHQWYGKSVCYVLSTEVVCFLECPLLEVPLYTSLGMATYTLKFTIFLRFPSVRLTVCAYENGHGEDACTYIAHAHTCTCARLYSSTYVRT